mgnify:CR=1 FL=1
MSNLALKKVNGLLIFYSGFNDHLFYEDNHIKSFDFNPSGELVATIDSSGNCLVADVNTDVYSCHMDMGMGKLGKFLDSRHVFSL